VILVLNLLISFGRYFTSSASLHLDLTKRKCV